MIAKAGRPGKQECAVFSRKMAQNTVRDGCEGRAITTARAQPKEQTKIPAHEWPLLANVTCCVRTDR
jgi:hypothetical protein